ncbi:MAG: ABC transporter ATP-binding protein [Anaerolineaceae bacterium]|nr:ABC transporter ATP-binding protein [Anaerolineaceae bacterium]
MAQPILEVHDLVKRYGTLTAVNEISFSIEEGEVFGLLGPNGAGKSTTISMLTGLLPPDDGTIRILGCDAIVEVEKVKHLIGIVPQDLALYPTLSARENIRFFGEMYGLGGKRLAERIESVLQTVAMTERANDAIQSCSGGMKRRVNLAVGLVNNPRILFLDEPTVGVDPQSRNHIFESVQRLNQDEGITILYTTHYMEEATRLCQRIAIIDHGKIIALDTPKNLVAMLGGGIIQIGLSEADEDLCQQISQLSQVRTASFLPQLPPEVGQEENKRAVLKIEVHQANEAMLQVIQVCSRMDREILSLETLEPNLETVFLHLTGKSLRQ